MNNMYNRLFSFNTLIGNDTAIRATGTRRIGGWADRTPVLKSAILYIGYLIRTF